MRVLIVVVVAALLGGCVGSDSVLCEDGRTCPAGKACDDVHGLCVDPDQLTSCGPIDDNNTCVIEASETPGECDQGVCLEQLCGDRAITHDEACDGIGTRPTVGTCIDFQFDYGALTCSSLCDADPGECGTLGWKFRTYPGVGQNSAIWQDGDTYFIANQNGIGRCTPTSCTVDSTVRRWFIGIWASGGHIFAVDHDGRAHHFDGTAWSEAPLTTPGQVGIDFHGLNAVWGRSPSDVFAVGRLGKIFRFNGSTWTEMTTPVNTPLRAVWGTATTVFAAGDNTTLLRLDGSTWTPITLTGSLQTFDYKGVWGSSASDIFVIGVEPQGNVGVAVHYTGGSTVGVEPLPTGTAALTAIHGRSATEVYAVTVGGDVIMFDGRSWTRMLKPANGPLAAVHAGTDRVVATGGSDLMLEYNYRGWVESPNRPTSVSVAWGAALDKVFAIQGCSIYEYDGALWTPVALPSCVPCTESPPTGVNFWLDMFGTSEYDVYAAGPYGTVMHRQDSAWNCVPLPASVLGSKPMWSQGVWASSPNDVFIVGGAGDGSVLYAVHYNGSTWEDWSDRLRPHLDYAFGVWGSGANDVYVVGTKNMVGGKVVHYNGSTWTSVDTGIADMPSRAIWGSGPNDVYVAGGDVMRGSLVHFDGSQWSQVAIPEGINIWTTSQYSHIHGSGPNNVFVSGTRTLLHYDGKAWSPIRRPDADIVSGLQVIGDQLWVMSTGGLGIRLVGDLSQ